MFKAITISIGILMIFIVFLILFLIESQRRKRRYYLQQLDRERAYQRELIQSQVEIQEQTLQQIAQEIHDNINQSLSLAKLNLNTVDLQQPEKATDKIESSRDLVAKAIQDLRDLSRSLNADSALSIGLVRAIERELTLMEKSNLYTTKLSMRGQQPHIDPRKELILFRVFQEALNNIIKHAKATEIRVEIDYSDQQMRLRIADNGAGFQTEAASEGIGLHNIRNRAALIGAKLEMDSSPAGTILELTLPTETS